ncbi:Retrovirus-related Pol polyprotein from transposon RE1 [Vitis vinifera]|uniref:Retrovirus-related Pol polyprotein from transposon RE1 n=1 Tax=Vitis vinifera TaxID=29760 RepID=A0A438D0V5_VITVI|nr:Retrovirus-related Pol polyprotein from transposon RE1 [Vitis vinifera]
MPETTEPGFRKWKIENSMIMSWLINSMNNDIGENFLLFGTAKDIWDAAKETYSSSENTSELFRQIVEQKRLFKFFLGLNRELDDVRGRIMGIKPLPSLREAFSEVRREESRKKVMMGSKSNLPQHWMPLPLLLGHLIVVVEIVRNGIGLATVDRDGRAHVAANSESTSVPEPSPFNKEQMEMLQKIKPSWQWQYYRVAFTANRGGMKPWIVTQDLKSGKMIGSAELCSGLYLLSCGQFSNQVSQASCVQSQSMLESFNSVSNSKSHQILPNSRPLSCPHPCRHQSSPASTNVPSPVTIQSPMPIQPIAPQLANENLQVYIRRRKRQELEHGSQSTCGQYIDSNSSLPEENIGEDRAGEVPNTIQEALKISEWKKAVQDEIDALEKNGTWTITDLPVGKRPVGCKWIFTIKYKADGSVERFKARLDSSLIGCQSRLVLATTGHKKCVSKWDLEEEVYMEIPPGFEESMAKNQNLKKYLSEEFEVKDLGNLKYFLGMEVARSRKGIVVSQRKYILDLLKETGMLGCKPIDTPMDSQKKLGIEKESTPVDRGRYQRLVGRLIYLSHTRPDIGFAVSAVSQFMHSPTEEHMEAVYRILRYLKMTPGKGYSSERQRTVTLKYTQMRIGQETSLTGGPLPDIVLLSGEILLPGGAAISIAKNPVHHDRTKHVEIDRHFITEKVTSETVKLNYVPTKHQTADILTKALPRPNFEDLTCKLGLYDIYSPA